MKMKTETERMKGKSSLHATVVERNRGFDSNIQISEDGRPSQLESTVRC